MTQNTLDKKEAIRLIVHASVESFAVGFQGRHEGELEDPEGTLNMKIHNVLLLFLAQKFNTTPHWCVLLIARWEIC